MTGRYLAILALFAYGIAFTLHSYSAKANGWRGAFFFTGVAYVISVASMLAFSPPDFSRITALSSTAGIVVGFMFCAGLVILSTCAQVDPEHWGINSMIFNMFPVLTILLLYFGSRYLPDYFMAQKITWQNIAGIILSCAGLFMLIKKWK